MHLRTFTNILLTAGLSMSAGLSSAQSATQDMKNAGTSTRNATRSAGSGVSKGTRKAYHKSKNGTKKAYHKVDGNSNTK